jgi:hypothetical protein
VYAPIGSEFDPFAGLSEAGGMGLGTLGYQEGKARQLTEEAGFARFEDLTDIFQNRTNNVFMACPAACHEVSES